MIYLDREVYDPSVGSDSLWLIFKLREQFFAVDAGYIHSISVAPEDIVPMPLSPVAIRGIVPLRGQITPMLDLRLYLGLPVLEQEYEDFTDMLEARKQDHVRWVTELKRCVGENQPFGLATDPHKCAFGKWYDSFRSPHQSVSFHLAKIDEPHQNLHAMAVKALSCQRDCEHCAREECLQVSLHRAEEEYMPRVLSLLEEAKTVFRSHFREMSIVISDGSRQIGLIVDEVLSVAQMELVSGYADIAAFSNSNFVRGIGRSDTVSSEVLMIDTDVLFQILAPA